MKGNSPQETKEKLNKHYGASDAPSIKTAYKWFQCTKEGQDRSSSQEGYGNCLSGFARNNLYDYLKKDKTITGAYYTSLLDCLKTKLQKKRPPLLNKKVLFH